MAGQMKDVVPFLTKYPNFQKELLLDFLGLAVSFVLIKKIVKTDLKNKKTRIGLAIVSLLILVSPYFFTQTFNKILEANKIIFHSWYRLENCQNNGMILCFINDAQFSRHPEPKNYSQNEIKKIFEKVPVEATVKKQEIKPNIIVIMSESLWDATKIPNIKLSPDPLANIRKDIKGTIISPTYGGGTANVEFEFLTGLSNYLFQDNSYPYTDLVRKKMPSLFSVFEDNGYPTSVIHPYSQQFYNRKNVYKCFGLDKFTSLDQMSGCENAGPFVSDKSFVNEILKQFNTTDKPQFIFGISMQNHDLYEPNRFKNEEIKIDGNLEKRDKDTLQSYIEGVNLTDKSYLELKEELKKHSDKPTIVVMFGDHLPFLNDNYSVYEKGGFVPSREGNWSQKDEINMHSTPLAMWSNFDMKIEDKGELGLPALASEVLRMANIEPKYQFRFTSELEKKYPYLVKKINPQTAENEEIIKEYSLVQYDLLFGKQYVKSL